MRERGWEGLPPPPVFATGKPSPTAVSQGGPAATPVVLESDAALASTATLVTRSPSMSIASLSDFTIADTSDDEYPIGPTAAAPHETFYFEDGNAEVLCGNTIFRVHTTTLSSCSLVLRRMFTQTRLAAAESPNGCPRILSSDTPEDFAALLKMIYLPGFVALPACR